MTFQPSPQQQKIFDAIASQSGNIIVDAKAGSGKTTTIVQGITHVPQDGLMKPLVAFIAFNKSIADTLRSKCPSWITCSTFHALGFRTLRDTQTVPRNVKVDGNKVSKILRDMDYDGEDFGAIRRLVSLLKTTPHNWDIAEIDPRDLIEYHNLDFVNPTESIAIALDVIRTSLNNTDTIDFDDMLYMPVRFDLRFPHYEYVFVDEAQDTNDVQLAIIDALLNHEKRYLVAVGDPHQAIYGFRGANADSMTRIATRFSCETFPLSVSYRCPKAVVREAQKYLKT